MHAAGMACMLGIRPKLSREPPARISITLNLYPAGARPDTVRAVRHQPARHRPQRLRQEQPLPRAGRPVAAHGRRRAQARRRGGAPQDPASRTASTPTLTICHCSPIQCSLLTAESSHSPAARACGSDCVSADGCADCFMCARQYACIRSPPKSVRAEPAQLSYARGPRRAAWRTRSSTSRSGPTSCWARCRTSSSTRCSARVRAAAHMV